MRLSNLICIPLWVNLWMWKTTAAVLYSVGGFFFTYFHTFTGGPAEIQWIFCDDWLKWRGPNEWRKQRGPCFYGYFLDLFGTNEWYIYIHIYIYIYLFMYLFMIYVYIYMCMYVHIYIYICMIYVYKDLYILYIYTYVYSDIMIYIIVLLLCKDSGW